ncbi:MAG: hypothetical protein ACYC9L_15585 [Sulfuricaulis sp.]
MNKDHFKGRNKETKGRIREISGKMFRDKLLEKKERSQRIEVRNKVGYGDIQDDIPGYDDIEDDIREYGDFSNDGQKSG